MVVEEPDQGGGALVGLRGAGEHGVPDGVLDDRAPDVLVGGEQRQGAVALGGRVAHDGIRKSDRAQPELGAAVQGGGHRARPGAGSDDEGGGGPPQRRTALELVGEATARARQYDLEADGGEQRAPAHGPGRVHGGRDGGDRAPQDGGPSGQHGQFEERGGCEPRPVEPGLCVQRGEQEGAADRTGSAAAGRVVAVSTAASASAVSSGSTRPRRRTRRGRRAVRAWPVLGPRGGWMAVAERRAAAGCTGAKALPPVGPVPPCPVCRAGALSIVIG